MLETLTDRGNLLILFIPFSDGLCCNLRLLSPNLTEVNQGYFTYLLLDDKDEGRAASGWLRPNTKFI